MLVPGELDLEIHQVPVAERDLRADQVVLPHPAEALVVDRLHPVALGEEALAPLAERHRVVHPQDFHVGDLEAGLLDRRHHLGDRGDVAAREDVFLDPDIGIAGPVEAADRMDQGDAVRSQQVAADVEERPVVIDADMLEHAHRDDGVERAFDVAVVLEQETRAIRQAAILGALVGDGVLLLRKRHAGDLDTAAVGEVEAEPAPAAADVEHLHPRLERQLRRDVALLGKLRRLEVGLAVLEIGAGILLVAVEEE